MKHLYLDNYMQLSTDEKKNFLSYLQMNKEFKVSSIEMVCSEGALILGLFSEQDANIAFENLAGFFQKAQNIKIDFVKKLPSTKTYTVLSFSRDSRRIRV